MDLEVLHQYCMQKLGASESFPFDQQTLVFKVFGKMFALVDVDDFTSINLKCDPERAIDLRERYAAVKHGFHMNHKHWNTIVFHEDVSDSLILELIDHSYQLVYQGLPKKVRDENPLG
ncbi:MAG: MmcQ/YjbR family DNA-binding protein [Flavobacteriales bacterium]